ncbi:hypothetical protein BSR28_04080 [Boudabousia liubingyangii]|uniref:endolytic transglycosylase MltG n=1 Tax=Boudabousia liubingyangii TaxID=1921764 RepID=UPI00093FB65F|nr:endolytic transglycosylase MltG [Boudabousia liubingyangii]OKL47675.1 hypothetical protein BSR28_04080 [Boudabousia liubingyangii]
MDNQGEPTRRIPSRRELRAQREQALAAQQNETEPKIEEPRETPSELASANPSSEAQSEANVAPVVEETPITAPVAENPVTTPEPTDETTVKFAPTTPVSAEAQAQTITRQAIENKARRIEQEGGPREEFLNTSRKQPKKQKRGRIISTLIILLLMAALVFGGIYLAKMLLGQTEEAPADYSGGGSGVVTVEIPQGATGSQIASMLKEQDVVASTDAFVSAFKANPEAKNIQPGTYTLANKMSSAAAVAALLDSANRVDNDLTIPEGFTLKQIKQRLIKRAGYTEEQLNAALKDTNAIGLPAEAKGNVEGWIAPATYTQKKGEDAKALFKTMIETNTKRLEKLGIPRDQWQVALTKGSILEREVAKKEYLPMVARVIDNRLDAEKGKEVLNRLQMDSTVAYASGRTSGLPTQQELQADSPYNTYKNAGLPPTPIGVVGDAALEAVMHPADGNWLYFVTTNLDTGETKFYDTYDEFVKGKAELAEYCKTHEKSCY